MFYVCHVLCIEWAVGDADDGREERPLTTPTPSPTATLTPFRGGFDLAGEDPVGATLEGALGRALLEQQDELLPDLDLQRGV
jgi:hypothetical protein